MRKKLSEFEGITLIALVITIIILLILATITIVELRNTNLFSKTIEARNKYKTSAEDENNTLDDYANKINEINIYSKNTNSENINSKKYYKIIYDANNGTGSIKTQEVVEGETTTLTLIDNQITRDGYKFNGWNTKADGSGTTYEDGSEITVTSNINLFAQWEENNKLKIFTPNTNWSYLVVKENSASSYGSASIGSSSISLSAVASDNNSYVGRSAYAVYTTPIDLSKISKIEVEYTGGGTMLLASTLTTGAVQYNGNCGWYSFTSYAGVGLSSTSKTVATLDLTDVNNTKAYLYIGTGACTTGTSSSLTIYSVNLYE